MHPFLSVLRFQFDAAEFMLMLYQSIVLDLQLSFHRFLRIRSYSFPSQHSKGRYLSKSTPSSLLVVGLLVH